MQKSQLIASNTGCIVAKRYRGGKHYAKEWVDGKRTHSHTAVWERHFGPILKGMYVLHMCDFPPCHNPEHLFLGTNLDNIADMVSKGRNAKGPTSGHYRHDVDADAIFAAEGFQRDIAARFGVSQWLVCRIKRGLR